MLLLRELKFVISGIWLLQGLVLSLKVATENPLRTLSGLNLQSSFILKYSSRSSLLLLVPFLLLRAEKGQWNHDLKWGSCVWSWPQGRWRLCFLRKVSGSLWLPDHWDTSDSVFFLVRQWPVLQGPEGLLCPLTSQLLEEFLDHFKKDTANGRVLLFLPFFAAGITR